MAPAEIVIIGLVVFAGVSLHAAIGFGGAMVIMPFLVWLVGLQTAVPTMSISGFVMTASVLAMSWRSMDFQSARGMIIGALTGVPFGLYLLKFAPEAPMQIALGALLIGFAVFLLVGPTIKPFKSKRWALLFGFCGGTSGAAFSIGGPPLVFYGLAQKWTPSEFRASLQAAFIAMGCLAIPGQYIAGLITRQVLILAAVSIPITGIGLLFGNWLHTRITPGRFDQVVRILLLLMGIIAVTKGVITLQSP